MPSPIIAEIGYLIGIKGDVRTEAFFIRALADRDFLPVELTSADYARMAELVEKYHDPLGTRDASVIALAERLDVEEIATPDRRHFTVAAPRHGIHTAALAASGSVAATVFSAVVVQ